MTEERRHLDFTTQYYERHPPSDPGLLRSGHGDAAHMCDAIAADIRRENTVRGRITRRGADMAEAVKRAGDAIWQMREAVCRAPKLVTIDNSAKGE